MFSPNSWRAIGSALAISSLGEDDSTDRPRSPALNANTIGPAAVGMVNHWAHAPGFYVILTDQPGEKSWPITASTFILMHKEPADKAASGEALKFFKWAFANGGKMAEELDYIPMPASVVQLIEKTWAAEIKS